MTSPMAGVQHLGRSLMLPIAVLPVAGLLLRLGQPDLLNIPFVAAAGDAIFSNLGLLFAIGVAVGFARENHGAAGLAGVVAFLVATKGAEALIGAPPELLAGLVGDARTAAEAAYKAQSISKLSVPAGILSGVIAGLLYNRYADIKLPDYLAFFGGRRFVPIASGFAGLILAAGFGFGWNSLEAGMDAFSRGIVEAGGLGLFIYGVLNRILIVTGLHHILNNAAWFILGDFEGVTGDMKRFFAGDPAAGAFMSGFFPVMMFGLPAACLAMYHAAAPERRKAVGGMLLSMALTSFLTGVTEPIEFTFMFLAPLLYAVHGLLTGLAMSMMDMLGVKLGFGFSAGFFDYVLNFNKATRPWLLLPVGAVYFALYYAMFRICISAFNLKTPGRGEEAQEGRASGLPAESALGYVRALGGPGNLESVGACTTRLRLIVRDQSKIDEAALKALGAKGVIRPSANMLQVVIGPTADLVAAEIKTALGTSASATRSAGTEIGTDRLVADSGIGSGKEKIFAVENLNAFLKALGGAANVKSATPSSNRLCLELVDQGKVIEKDLKALGVRAVAYPAPGKAHLLTPNDVGKLAADIENAVA